MTRRQGRGEDQLRSGRRAGYWNLYPLVNTFISAQ